MKKTTSTILKEQDDGIEVEEEKLGNKSPLFDRKIEIATEGCFRVSQKHFVTNYHLRTL